MLDTNSTPQTPYDVHWLGARYRVLLSAADSGGSIGIFESVDEPGYGPPRHIHHKEDETFLVQSGDVEFWLEGRRFECGPGEVVFVPRGKEHAFRIIGNKPGRLTTIMTPGGFEDFFRHMQINNCRVPEDLGLMSEIGARYNLEFTGPPLSADD
jgi:mannose-6-phosphate isomerase-like protein (cupin superfamily)